MSKARHFLNLFRVFLPSWKFFDEVGSAPELYYQMEGPWQPVLIRPANKLRNLFLHPEGNFFHAGHSLLERLLREVNEAEPSDLESSPSYQLVENLVRFQIRQADPTLVGRQFRFKIAISHPEPADVILSASHEV